jgi:hypothetical protein
MIINHKVALGSWTTSQGSANTRQMKAAKLVAAIEVDGVVVMFENPDQHDLVVTTIGGDAKTNKRVLGLWSKCEAKCEADQDPVPSLPEVARRLFIRWLVENEAVACLRRGESVVSK